MSSLTIVKNLTTRARIIILVLLAGLPALAVILYSSWDERVRAVAVARQDIQRLAALAAQQQEQVIEGAKQSLVAISLMPTAVRNDRASCNDYLARLLAKSAGLYHSIGIYGVDGFLQCNAIPWQGKVYSPDRLYFRLALATGKFAIGEYQVGRVTKQQGINFGYPISDEHTKVSGVAFIALDLASLSRMAAAVPLPEQGVLAVIDRDGVLLARYPPIAGRVGDTLPFPKILKTVLGGRNGDFTAKGFGGLDRLIAFNTVAVNPDGGIPIRVVVSVPSSVILAEANRALMRDVVGIVLATVLLLIGAWHGADIFVLRNLRRLLEVARKVHGGDLTARTGLPAGREEISHLGSVIDNMAQALQDREAALQQALRESVVLAITDPLTGLNNRRYLWDLLERELLKAGRSGKPIAAIMMDIDHFKRFNDTWGHEVGDMVLKGVAGVIREHVRGYDIACRYGGEELVVILPETTLEVAIERAETIRLGIAAMRLDYYGRPLDIVTASLGVAVYPQHAGDAEALLRAADKAMYQAKAAGRDRVVVAISRSAAA